MGQTRELVKAVSGFKSCVGLVLILEWHLMVCTAEVDSIEDSVLSNFID